MKLMNFGSLNLDRIYTVSRFVSPGETILARSLKFCAGGKGLNQSVAAARAGAEVIHAGAVGPEGEFLKETLFASGADASRLLHVREETGHAVIQVNASGQNAIIVYGGANRCLTQAYIDKMLPLCDPGDILLLQNETNAVGTLIRKGHERGLRVVWNPSPFPDPSQDIPFALVDCFILNEIEGSMLAGVDPSVSGESLLEALSARYPKAAFVLTLGREGAMYRDRHECWRQRSFPVEAVDTTGAGDTFCGFFLAGLCCGRDVPRSLREASAAAAIAVSRPGAAPSIPTAGEVAAFLDSAGIVP